MRENASKCSYRIGTAGWSYKDWTGVFYPPELPQQEWLEFYSKYFNVIEVNSTYYAHPNPKVVHNWVEKIAPQEDFSFILKMHQSLTHQRKFDLTGVKAIRDNLGIINDAGRLCGMLVQFPYSFDCSDSNIQYLNVLADAFSEFTLFLELRHKSWDKREIENEIQKKYSLCAIDQPQIGQSLPFHPVGRGTSLYIRLHGRNAAAWKNSLSNYGQAQTYAEQNERYNYLYNRGELVEIMNRIKDAAEQVKEIVIITNNHPYGNAVLNAFELMEFLKLEIGEGKPPQVTERLRRLSRIK